MTLSMKQIFSKFNLFEIGMAIGRGGAEGWGLHPRPAWFYLAPSLPRLVWWGKLSHPIPTSWGPAKPHPYPVKLYILLICLTTSTIFLMKPISLIKIYLKLQLNLSHQIKSLFRKKLNNISKHLTRWLQKKIL